MYDKIFWCLLHFVVFYYAVKAAGETLVTLLEWYTAWRER